MILELESQSTTVLKCLFSIVTSLLKRERVGTFNKKIDLEVGLCRDCVIFEDLHFQLNYSAWFRVALLMARCEASLFSSPGSKMSIVTFWLFRHEQRKHFNRPHSPCIKMPGIIQRHGGWVVRGGALSL